MFVPSRPFHPTLMFVGKARGVFVKHVSPTYVAQKSVTKIISPIFINLVTPKARANHNHLFNKPASGAYPIVEYLKCALL